MVKKLIIFMLFFSLCVTLCSAIGVESAEFSPNPVGRGDLFTLTVVLDHSSSADVEFPLKELPDNLLLWRGPYIRTFVESGRGGETKRKVRITTTFKAQSSGRLIVPGLTIIAGGSLYKTDPMLLRVGLYKSRKLYMPLEVQWQAAFDDIYAGEAVPVFLVVKNQEVVSLFDRIRVAVPRDGFFEKAEGLGSIIQKSEGNVVLYDIPAASYVFTSPVAGTVRIPAAGVDSDGVTGWTDNLDLRIKPVPEQISSTGAIGNLDYQADISRRDVAAGEEIVLTAVVSGTGNLNYLKIPEPEAAGCILVARDETEDYIRSMSGYSGSKSVVWTYNPAESGEAEIKMPEFSFLNKASGIIETFPERVFKIAVSNAPVQVEAEEAETLSFEAVDTDSFSVHEWKNYYKRILNYIWLLPAALFYLLTRLLKGRRTLVALIITVIIMVAAISLLRSFTGLSDSGGSEQTAADYYNEAVKSYEDGDLAGALHDFRTAVYLEPMNRRYAGALARIEQHNGYLTTVSPSVAIHPDLFFYLFTAAVNLLFLAFFLKSLKPGGAVSVIFIMLLFSGITFGGVIIYSHVQRESLTGIVARQDAYIKKIPRASAENWLPLEMGTSARILEQAGEFMLIETGLGVTGWIEQSQMIKDRPE